MTRLGESALLPFMTLLGKVPDQQIAEKAGVSRALVVNYRKRNGLPAYQGYRLGGAGHVVAESGVTDEGARGFRGRRSALDPYLHLLGKVADVEIAKLADVTTENVHTYRQRRNIAPEWQSNGGEAPARATSIGRSTLAPTALAPAALAPAEAVRIARRAAPPAPEPVVAAVRPAAPAIPATPSPTTAGAGTTAFLVIVDTDQGARNYALVASDIAEAAGAALSRVSARHPDAHIRSIARVAELLP